LTENSTNSPGPSHIVPVLVGDAALAKAASDKLLSDHNIYVQSINHPTVAVGTERLRITVTPRHTLEQMDKLVRAVNQTFTELHINRLSDWKAVGGCAGVGEATAEVVQPIWTDSQVGLLDGTSPRTLRDGQKAILDAKAVKAARDEFNTLLGPVTVQSFDAAVSTKASVKMSAGTSADGMKQLHVPQPTAVEATA
jgi:5-aminolevulinate synthase